jgi:hypothetical protein
MHLHVQSQLLLVMSPLLLVDYTLPQPPIIPTVRSPPEPLIKYRIFREFTFTEEQQAFIKKLAAEGVIVPDLKDFQKHRLLKMVHAAD